MTPALRTFIDKVSSGPKFTDEFGLNSSSVFDAFKKCVMMGIEVHKKKVVRSGKSGATSLFYLNEHRFEAFDRVRGLLGTRSGVLWAEYATAMLEPNDFKTRSSGMHTIFCKCGIPLSKCKKCKKGGGK